jgi:hypothetical protein
MALRNRDLAWLSFTVQVWWDVARLVANLWVSSELGPLSANWTGTDWLGLGVSSELGPLSANWTDQLGPGVSSELGPLSVNWTDQFGPGVSSELGPLSAN